MQLFSFSVCNEELAIIENRPNTAYMNFVDIDLTGLLLFSCHAGYQSNVFYKLIFIDSRV